MRTCNCCGETKSSTEYGKNKGMPDGLLKVCKACMNAKQRQRAKTAHGRALGRKNGRRYRERHRARIKEESRKRRLKFPEQTRRTSRESAARRYAFDPQRVKDRAKAWQKANPERRRAQRKLNGAVERGEIVPPAHCGRCSSDPGKGRDGRRLIQAHHDDYSKPFDVEWVCPPCHKVADAERRA